jgi:hypothetical protein
MEIVRFSETLASTSESTRRPNPEEHHQYRQRRENLKSHKFNVVSLTMNLKFKADSSFFFEHGSS